MFLYSQWIIWLISLIWLKNIIWLREKKRDHNHAQFTFIGGGCCRKAECVGGSRVTLLLLLGAVGCWGAEAPGFADCSVWTEVLAEGTERKVWWWWWRWWCCWARILAAIAALSLAVEAPGCCACVFGMISGAADDLCFSSSLVTNNVLFKVNKLWIIWSIYREIRDVFLI